MSDPVERARMAAEEVLKASKGADSYRGPVMFATADELRIAADELERIKAENAALREALAFEVVEPEYAGGDDQPQTGMHCTLCGATWGREGATHEDDCVLFKPLIRTHRMADIKIDTIWQDKDSRMFHRKVLVERVEGGRVHYIECRPDGTPYSVGTRASSRLDRFPKAFRPLPPKGKE